MLWQKIFSDNEFSFVILDKCNLKYYKLLISKRNNYQILLAPHFAELRPTVGENIIATIEMRNNFWYPFKMARNIELFSIAPHLVIALPTLR